VIAAVTGANGFVGRVLIEALLARGWAVRALSRSHQPGADKRGVIWMRGDLEQPEAGEFDDFLSDADVLFHCAAELYDEARMEEVHIKGTERLVAAACGKIRRWVQLSSCGVYGPVRNGIITEDSSLHPAGVYEKTKLKTEWIIVQAAKDGAFEAVILRPSIIYGETMTNQSLRSWIRVLMKGLFFYIGKPGAIANYVHVDDVAEALCLCAIDRRAAGEVFNLSNGCTVEQFVGAMCEARGRSDLGLRIPEGFARVLAEIGKRIPGCPLTPARVNALTVRASYSSERIHERLGFVPKVSAGEGLSRLIQMMCHE